MSTAWNLTPPEEPASWSRRYRAKLTVGAVIAGAALLYAGWHFLPHPSGSSVPRETLLVVSVPPPPPPPPPPSVTTPPPPQPEEKMVEQAPVENEPKPEPAPDEPPPADLGTGLQGNGPADGFGLSGRGGLGGPGGHGNGQAQSRSRWGWYAGQVQGRIQQAVRGNRATRAAALRADVKLWVDSSGRVTRAKVADTAAADAALDSALRDQVLAGLQLSEPPPADMPMPIVLRLTLRRP